VTDDSTQSAEHAERYYTSAMLAELLGVPLSAVRRWHRRGLIVPVQEVRRLAYFDFQEVAVAQRLAQLLHAGATLENIEKKVADLARLLPGVQRPILQPAVIVQGQSLLVRQGDGLVEAGGQLRFDFEPAVGVPALAGKSEQSPEGGTPTMIGVLRSLEDVFLSAEQPAVGVPALAGSSEQPPEGGTPTMIGVLRSLEDVSLSAEQPAVGVPALAGKSEQPPEGGTPTMIGVLRSLEDLSVSAEQMRRLAVELEAEGRLAEAADVYRAAMAAAGPDPESCFELAELLYRRGELSAARERYYMAIELDENYVEARANLGCVLAEMGQRDLAVAAFEGALRYHADYADAHYHLARTLDEMGHRRTAEQHWRRFLALAPGSPWAAEAEQRLG